MSTALAPVQNGALATANQADEWNDARREFIRKNFCGGAPDAIAGTFLEICQRRRLSPEARHVYLVNRAKKGDSANWIIQTGIDGYRLIAARTGLYAGSSEPAYVYGQDGDLMKATVTVNKVIGQVVGAFTASALWSEYQAGGPMWNKMPHTMLAKCAEALALRKAFPEELSGIYTSDEMDQAELPVDRVPQDRPRPARATAQGSPAAIRAKTGEMDWTEFWRQAKAVKIAKADFVEIIQREPNSFASPQDAWDALSAALEQLAATQIHPETVEADYEVDPDTGEILEPGLPGMGVANPQQYAR